MAIRVLLVAARPERGWALHRLTRLTAAAWRERGARVHVTEPGGRNRSTVRHLAAEADLVQVVDHRDAPVISGLGGPRTVVWCHDLTDLREDLGRGAGSRLPQPLRRSRARAVASALAGADRVLAATEHLCSEVADLTDRSAELIGPPVDPSLLRRAAAHDAWEPPRWPYLLAVGGSAHRQSRESAIVAWAGLRRTSALDGSSLVLVGPPLSPDEERLATSCGGYLTVMSDVSDLQLGALYRSSRALLHLERPGAFAWPVIEAQQAGRPVLANDHPALEEVGRAGCVYLPVEGVGRFDPATWQSVAEDLTSRVVVDRAEANARRFSWDRFVDRLPQVSGMPAAVDTVQLVPAMLGASALLPRPGSDDGPIDATPLPVRQRRTVLLPDAGGTATDAQGDPHLAEKAEPDALREPDALLRAGDIVRGIDITDLGGPSEQVGIRNGTHQPEDVGDPATGYRPVTEHHPDGGTCGGKDTGSGSRVVELTGH